MEIILGLALKLIGTILFFLPGVLLTYIIFPKTDIIKRGVYSIINTISISTILGVFLYCIGYFTYQNILLSFIFLIVILLLIIVLRKREIKTDYNKDIFYITLFSLIGVVWKTIFWGLIQNRSDAYGYAFKFVGEKVPDLGFYTGMAADRTGYLGLIIPQKIIDSLTFNSYFLMAFLACFLYLGLIYIIFKEYRSRKLALIGIAIMSLGPIEIFYSLGSIFGHSVIYFTILLTFILFKSKNNNLFFIAIPYYIAVSFTYYTATISSFLISIGFFISLIIKEIIINKKPKKIAKAIIKNKKIYGFAIIILILFLFILSFSGLFKFSIGKAKDLTDASVSIENVFDNSLFNYSEGNYSLLEEENYSSNMSLEDIEGNIIKNKRNTFYKNPSFLGFSAIRWQIIFFFLCGMTFVIYLLNKRNFKQENLDLALCFIPVILVSYGLFHTNLLTRIFNYFSFFGLLSLKIPKQYLKKFAVISLIFLLITGAFVMKDKKVFFETSIGETRAAEWISNNLNGKVFSDQFFINQLVQDNYFNVTGADDKSYLVYFLFYQRNSRAFEDKIGFLKDKYNVDYIVLTKRMREDYILMVNYPQIGAINSELYERILTKVYDNGDVRIYSTEIMNNTINNEDENSSIPPIP